MAFYACLLMGLFTAALWAVPLVLLRLVFFPDGQFQIAFRAVTGWCIALNVVALIVNLIDKWAAREGLRRVSECTLFLFTLLGAGPATVWAMICFNHKSSKESYHATFLCMSFFSILFIGGAFGLAYGLEWHFMDKNVISTTIPYINSTTFSSATGRYFTDYHPTTVQGMTTLVGNSSTLVSNATTITAFDLLSSAATSRQNFSAIQST